MREEHVEENERTKILRKEKGIASKKSLGYKLASKKKKEKEIKK